MQVEFTSASREACQTTKTNLLYLILTGLDIFQVTDAWKHLYVSTEEPEKAENYFFLGKHRTKWNNRLASLNCRVRTPELMIMFWCFALTDFLPLPLQWKLSSHYELIKKLCIYVFICERVCVGWGLEGMLCREERKRYTPHQNQITTKNKIKKMCFLPPKVEMPSVQKKIIQTFLKR